MTSIGTYLAIYMAVGVVILMWFRRWRNDRAITRRKEEQIFRVTREALIEPLTVDEIESRELVSDPSGAAPCLPFGHLNKVWCQLKSELKPGDQLWSFSKRWQDDWGRPDLRAGYAIWRRSKAVFHIYTMWKSLDVSLTNAPSGRESLNRDLADIEVPAFLRRQAD